jgi:hypothetical protein
MAGVTATDWANGHGEWIPPLSWVLTALYGSPGFLVQGPKLDEPAQALFDLEGLQEMTVVLAKQGQLTDNFLRCVQMSCRGASYLGSYGIWCTGHCIFNALWQ